jgi:ATP-dependent RNA helicase DeaD
MKFEDFGLSHELLKVIKNLQFDKPTQIQKLSIPHIIRGKDVIGESATGSGKTLAFGCGIVEHVSRDKGLQALILTPTRELTEQVRLALQRLSRIKGLSVISVYGGVAIDPQVQKLSKANVVVATPGRLLDHLQRRTIDLSKVKLLVLDEADRMLDMGFLDDVEMIIRACPKKRQTLFFSATISMRIRELADRYMIRPIQVNATKMVDPRKLKQVYYDVPRNMKFSLLAHLLEHEKSRLVMVFCNSRKSVDFVVKNLKTNKIRAIAIHGGYSQNKRTKTIELFNDERVSVLVCTDVAARGLHIENVSHVYNYEIPKDAKDYIHRIGRTARAGEDGKVINLLCDYDHDNYTRIREEYREFRIDRVDKPYVKRLVAVKEVRKTINRTNSRNTHIRTRN